MKHGRIISIKNPKLRKIRNNLRRLFKEAVWSKHKLLRIRKNGILEKSENNPTDTDIKAIQRLNKEQSDLRVILKCSICKCGMCNTDNEDMVWHAGWGEWWCLKCFKDEEEIIDPKDKFNKGVIVHENAEKPCHTLHWCPYGSLVENFRLRNMYSKYTCLVFDHDCPVFYISEFITELSSKKLFKHEKLKDNLKNYENFNNKDIIVHEIEKPCHLLNWCPYGSMSDKLFERELDYKYGCKIFPHDCPVFYHAEFIKESLD